MDLKEFIPLKGNLPKNFSDAVGWLQRPYTQISKTKYYCLLTILKNNDSDFFMIGDKVVTIGNADGGFAIMPLQLDRQIKILNQQK